MAGKLATKYAPPTVISGPKVYGGTVEPLLVRESVSHMSPDQFAVYDSALREINYYDLSPEEQQNYTVAIQAVNERRQREGFLNQREGFTNQPGFNVTIRDGNRASVLPSLPFGLQWTPLVAVIGVLIIASLMGRR